MTNSITTLIHMPSKQKTSINACYLIIVESPSKCGKIENYLGPNYQCIASKGHIRELDGLKNIDVKIPLGRLICITGVSGSGKSTLMVDVLYQSLAKELHRAKSIPGDHDHIEGLDRVDKVINIDQSPIGRTPRSNPATYTKLFDHIRKLFAELPESKIRGYKPGRFSFNVH